MLHWRRPIRKSPKSPTSQIAYLRKSPSGVKSGHRVAAVNRVRFDGSKYSRRTAEQFEKLNLRSFTGATLEDDRILRASEEDEQFDARALFTVGLRRLLPRWATVGGQGSEFRCFRLGRSPPMWERFRRPTRAKPSRVYGEDLLLRGRVVSTNTNLPSTR